MDKKEMGYMTQSRLYPVGHAPSEDGIGVHCPDSVYITSTLYTTLPPLYVYITSTLCTSLQLYTLPGL